MRPVRLAWSCSPVAASTAPAYLCKTPPTTDVSWYRAQGNVAAIRAVNGVRALARPLDRLTGTLALSPYLRSGGENLIEAEAPADVWIERVPRVSIVHVADAGDGNLEIWVENSLENAANVEIRLGTERRSLCVPPEYYAVASFPAGRGPTVQIELTKFDEALEGGYEVLQRFERSVSGKWNPSEAP